MSRQDVDNVRAAYDSFNRGQMDAAIAIQDEEVEWTEPGGGDAPAGTFKGPKSVANDVFAKVPEKFDEFAAQPEDLREEGETIIVTGRFRGRSKSGAELDAPFEHTYEMRDGKVRRFSNKVDEDAWAKAWS